MKKISALCTLLILCFSLFCQTKDTTRISVDIGLTGNIQTGNFERLQFINQVNVVLNSKNQKWNFTSRNLYLYQTVFGNKSQDDYLGRHFAAYQINSKTDVFAAFFIEQYFIKRIDLHTQFGLGTRYTILQNNRAFVQLGLMGSYSDKKYVGANFTDFDNDGNSTIQGVFISPILNSKISIIPKRIYFDFLGWFQQDISETQNWRFNLESSLLIPLYKGLNMKFSFNNFYEHINIEGTKANDIFLTYGLNYKFRK